MKNRQLFATKNFLSRNGAVVDCRDLLVCHLLPVYGACVRIARGMGYKKVITYTLESENGASLRAANFTFAGSAGGIAWTGTRRRDYYVSPEEMKNRWEYVL